MLLSLGLDILSDPLRSQRLRRTALSAQQRSNRLAQVDAIRLGDIFLWRHAASCVVGL